MKPDERAILLAAIVWDRPKLVASRRDDARRFVQAMDLRVFPEGIDSPDSRQGSLWQASRGLIAEVTGRPEEARAAYTTLTESDAALEVLLGRLLLAWMESATQSDLDAVLASVDSSDIPGELVPRIHSKLMTWALDHGWRDYAALRHRDAVESAQGDLRNQLEGVASWFHAGLPLILHGSTDELVSYPWIKERVGYSARQAVERAIIDSSRSPSTRTRTFGSAKGPEVEAAHMQANWAGALWLLPEVSRQLAAQILSTPGGPDDLARGLSNWVLGNGGEVERVIDSREALFSSDTARSIIVDHLREGSRVRRIENYIDSWLALWDQVPQEQVNRLIAEIQIPENPQASNSSARLFAVLSVRSPQLWTNRFDRLPRAARLPVAANVTPQAARHLTSLTRASILDALLDGLDSDTDLTSNGSNAWIVGAALIESSVRPELRAVETQFLERIPDEVIPLVARMGNWPLGPQRIRRAIDSLAEYVREDLTSAQKGLYIGRNFDACIRFATALLASEPVSSENLDLLLRSAVSPTSSVDHQLGALNGIRLLVEAGHFSREQLAPVLGPLPRGNWLWDKGEPDEQLRAAQLAVAVLIADDALDFDGELLAASRSQDVEVRKLAIDAGRSASKRRSSSALDTVQFGALYDPDRDIQRRGVTAVAEGSIKNPSLIRAATERIFGMWSLADRYVRASIAQAATVWPHSSDDDNFAPGILEMARKDRSWIVRSVVDMPDS